MIDSVSVHLVIIFGFTAKFYIEYSHRSSCGAPELIFFGWIVHVRYITSCVYFIKNNCYMKVVILKTCTYIDQIMFFNITAYIMCWRSVDRFKSCTIITTSKNYTVLCTGLSPNSHHNLTYDLEMKHDVSLSAGI